MEATITMYEPKHEHLKTVRKHGKVIKFVWVIEFGPFVFIKPSELSAHRFLVKHGFELNDDGKTYSHKFKSEPVIDLEKNYIKY